MTTTAHEDQFTDAPDPVRQPYDTGSILRQNVADLELALKQQTERAEAAEEKLTTAREDMQSWIDSRNGWMERAGAAEAELLAVREDNHSMMLEIDELRKELAKLREQKPALYMAFSECGQFIRYWTRDTANLDATMAVNDFTVLEFFARPTPATAVPTDEQIHAAYRTALGQSIRERDMPEIRKFANELLQSADHSERNLEKVATDCRASTRDSVVRHD